MKNKPQFYDFAPFSGDREKTEEGYLAVNVVATSVGIQDYDSADFGLEAGTTMGLFRTPETVFHDETIKSFSGRPVTIGHDGEMIDVDSHKNFSQGNAMGDAFPIDKNKLGIRILVTDPDTVRRIEDGELTGVSLGYSCNQEIKRGDFEGKRFDAITEGPMIINHVTLLPKSMPPRVKEARILDSDNIKKDIVMNEDEIKALIAAAIAEAFEKRDADKADQAEEEAKKDASDPDEEKNDTKDTGDEDKADTKDEDDKADAGHKEDKADAAKMDSRVNAAAAKRAVVMVLCDSVTSGKTNQAMLKDKLGADYESEDQAIGYLQAMNKLDSANRGDARKAFQDSSSGSAKVYDLNTIKKMEG